MASPRRGAAQRQRDEALRLREAVKRHLELLAKGPRLRVERLPSPPLESCLTDLLASSSAYQKGWEPDAWRHLDAALEAELVVEVKRRRLASRRPTLRAVCAAQGARLAAFDTVAAAEGYAIALAVRAAWEQGRLADTRDATERAILAEWVSRSEREMSNAYVRWRAVRQHRPAQSQSAAATNPKRTTNKRNRYAADRERILVMCIHEGIEMNDAVTQVMEVRKLTSREHYKKALGWRSLKKQIESATKSARAV